MGRIDFELIFKGESADDGLLDFYDAAEALSGFQRSLALTAHLVINDEIITQAPSLRGARIFSYPPEVGSWKSKAVVLTVMGTGAYHLGTAPKDTPLGHMVRSVYDYAGSQTLGIHVDYEKSLVQSYEDAKLAKSKIELPKESKLDSLIEKIETPVRQMHRPIVASQTADSATITTPWGGKLHKLAPNLSHATYEHMKFSVRSSRPHNVRGRVSSYNVNTYKGRIFCFDEQRPIPFILSEESRTNLNISNIISSMSANALSRMRGEGDLLCSAFIKKSKAGTVKRYIIISTSI